MCELPEGVVSVAYSIAMMSKARIDGVVVDERSSERGSGTPKMSVAQIVGVVLDERSSEKTLGNVEDEGVKEPIRAVLRGL